MSSRPINLVIYEAEPKPCKAPGCHRMNYRLSRYCLYHKGIYVRYGTLQRLPALGRVVSPIITFACDYINANRDDNYVAHGIEGVARLLREAPTGLTRQKLTGYQNALATLREASLNRAFTPEKLIARFCLPLFCELVAETQGHGKRCYPNKSVYQGASGRLGLEWLLLRPVPHNVALNLFKYVRGRMAPLHGRLARIMFEEWKIRFEAGDANAHRIENEISNACTKPRVTRKI